MRTKVKIEHYQGIDSVEFELGESTNAFVGKTDSGKSSIVRAIRDHDFNCLGHGHVMADEKVSSVVVDGVVWQKGKTVNRYKIGDKVYDGVGRGQVPEDVQKKTGVREVEFGDKVSRRLNVAGQFDPPFMVGENPSDNAKIIGSLSGVGVVFNALRDATADLSRSQREVNALEPEVETAKEKVLSFAWLPIAEKILEAAMADVDKLAEKGTLLGSVRTMQTQLATKRTEVGAQAERARRLKPKTEISFERYDELAGRLTPTRRLADGLAEARQRAQDSGRVIASCRAAMAAGQVIGRMEDLAGEKDKVLRLKDSLSVLTARALKAAGTVSSAKGNLKSVTEEHSKMIDRMGVCPLSGLEMPQACKAALKGEG